MRVLFTMELRMAMDKTIRKVTDLEEQQAQSYRYWQSRPVAERLAAVCELSESAYSFKESFKGVSAYH